MSERRVARPRGPSARLRLTLSYAGFLLVAGAVLLAVVWLFLLRYVPEGPIDASAGFIPDRGDLWRAFAPPAAAALAVLLVVGLGGGWLLSGRMLAPLAEIGSAARLAGAGSLSHRIEMPGAHDEFREVADAFDAMLAEIEALVAQQRRFAANASHELRTPLAITRTMLDVAQRDPDRDVDALLERLQHVNSRAIALADALLLLARSEHHGMASESVDLALLAESAVEDLLPLAERRGVGIDAMGDPVTTRGSEALLLQLVINLAHNGIVHNVGGGHVRISTSTKDRESVLRVENTGPSLEGVDLAVLTEPFQRGAGRVRVGEGGDHAGTGLGLAIVRHIVVAHRGAFRLEARPGGGAIATVRLPRA